MRLYCIFQLITLFEMIRFYAIAEPRIPPYACGYLSAMNGSDKVYAPCVVRRGGRRSCFRGILKEK